MLIADDSVVYRSQIRAALEQLAQIEVVGVSSNGRLALQRMMHSQIDLLILDLEMPEMDGLQTLKEMAANSIKCKVLVFTSVSRHCAEIMLEALRLGATDFITKPSADEVLSEAERAPVFRIRKLIEPRLAALFPDYEMSQQFIEPAKPIEVLQQYPKVDMKTFEPEIIVIAASTGGPSVLEKVFSRLKAPLNCPILVVQHMPPVFTATFAERIQKTCGIETREAVNGERLLPNRIYIAPGDYHMTLNGTRTEAFLEVNQGPRVQEVRPAADPLFEAAAAIFGEKCLGIVFTGMGADGRNGARKIKQAGGMILIQDSASCVVFGMPGAVKAVNAYDFILSPSEISEVILEKTRTSKLSTLTP